MEQRRQTTADLPPPVPGVCTRCGWPRSAHGTEQEDTTSCPVARWWRRGADEWAAMRLEFSDGPVPRTFAGEPGEIERVLD